MKAHNINKQGERIAITHGELCLTPVEKAPKGKHEEHTLYVAAHSESGHNHVIEAKNGLEVIESGNGRYLLIKEVSKLFHQKTFDIHETRHIAPGLYKVTHKTEYNPFTKVIERVWD